MVQEIDELKWINNFFDNAVDLKTEGIDRIRNFTLLWNLFENFACNKSADFNTISTAVENLNSIENIKIELLDKYLEYFADRYFNSDETPKQLFEGLKFRPSNNDQNAKELIKQVLIKKTTFPKEILKALLFRLYRFRNNLFHGEKDVTKLDNQIDNFKVANHILTTVLDLMKRNHLIT